MLDFGAFQILTDGSLWIWNNPNGQALESLHCLHWYSSPYHSGTTNEMHIAFDTHELVSRDAYRENCEINFSTNVQFAGGSVMVWVELSLGSIPDLQGLVYPSFKAKTYIWAILEPYSVPYEPFIWVHFLLMRDKGDKAIQHMKSLGRSTDQKPIEHEWDELKRAISRPSNPLESLDDHRTALIELWKRMD